MYGMKANKYKVFKTEKDALKYARYLEKNGYKVLYQPSYNADGIKVFTVKGIQNKSEAHKDILGKMSK